MAAVAGVIGRMQLQLNARGESGEEEKEEKSWADELVCLFNMVTRCCGCLSTCNTFGDVVLHLFVSRLFVSMKLADNSNNNDFNDLIDVGIVVLY